MSKQETPEYWWIKDVFSPPTPRPTGFAASDDDTFDVVVVGGGMAGFTTAILGHDAGSSVLLLEAADEVGGTTYKSGGGLWVPNNRVMRDLGVVDDRDTCLRYMAQVAHPDAFDAGAERFGMGEWEWEKLTAYYDNASDAIDALVAAGALRVRRFPSFTDRYPGMVSYHYELDQSIHGFLRHIIAENPEGGTGIGHELIRQLAEAAKAREIEVRTNHRVRGLVTDGDAVVGVTVETPDGPCTVHARQGVVFTTGGFPHDAELVDEHFRGPLYSSCAVGTARGDFVRIGAEAGGELGHMRNGWFYEDILEKAVLDRVSMEGGINVPTGDSMIYVDHTGNRVVNEKAIYQERSGIHWERGEDGTYPHRVLMMVYDEFVARDTRPWLFLDTFLPEKPWIISGDTLADLAGNVADRLATLEEHTDGFTLDDGFATALERSVARFNGFANAGKDEDFGRGESPTQLDWHGPGREGNAGNPTMHAFQNEGPYHCVLVCGMVLDTNGGPKTNGRSQVLRADGSVIEGLYGAGNCVAAVAGDGYLSGGSTLGPATAFGYLAAQNVTAEHRRAVGDQARATPAV